MFIYIYIYTYTHTHTHTHICFIPALLLLYFNVCVYVRVCVCVYTDIHVHMLYSCMLTLKFLCIFMLYLCFTPASPLLIYATAVILFYFNIFLYTPALLVLFLLCVYVSAYWPSRVCGAQ
jgi:hypothetical protein